MTIKDSIPTTMPKKIELIGNPGIGTGTKTVLVELIVVAVALITSSEVGV
jgi:hypothetical protein